MNLRFLSVSVSAFLASMAMAQQQSPFSPPTATAPVNQPTAGQSTTPANQGVATNPSGNATVPGQVEVIPTVPPNAATGTLTNSAGRPALGFTNTNSSQVSTTNGPLFLNVTPITVTDTTGGPIGVLQQLALSPSGQVNFGIVNAGGRLVPVPWQLIASGTTSARGTLALNAESGILQRAPAVAMGQLPMLTEDEIQAQILNHFGIQPRAQPSVVTTGTARGGTGRNGGLGVTITGGGSNSTPLARPVTTNLTGTTNVPNITRTNQAVNTTSGLLSPTGRTNGISDGFNSGPGSTDRLGPRQNASPTQPIPPVPPTNPSEQQ